jgi:hypothetical protein
MSDTYDAGYLPDDADCNQDSIRVELAYSHDFYTAIIEGQEECIAELESNYTSLSKANQWFIKRITELEKRLSNAETMGDKEQSIRDSEQQAKGISDFVSSIEGFSEGYIQALKEDK